MGDRLTGRRAFIATLSLAAALAAGCASGTGGSIPVEQYKDPQETTATDYTIGIGDLLNIQVWDQPQISGKMKVRTDGRISVPFVSDVAAVGKTPSKLAADLEAGLK